jgi:hypothetical protein
VHAIELPVDDPDGGAECMQLGGKRESRRSRADDEDVGFGVNRHRTRIFAARAVTRSELGQVHGSSRKVTEYLFQGKPARTFERIAALRRLRRARLRPYP